MRRPQLAAYVGVVAVAAAGLWRVETTANRADDTANRLDAEIEADAARACQSTLKVRIEQEELLAGLAVELGAEPATVEVIHRFYDDLPPPTDC